VTCIGDGAERPMARLLLVGPRRVDPAEFLLSGGAMSGIYHLAVQFSTVQGGGEGRASSYVPL